MNAPHAKPGPPPVKVSVHMPAYNHEAWIGQALDSALAQQTDFAFEVVIGEDCSTDGTRAVARAYADSHPDTIRLIENPRNLGIWENDQVIIEACRGEYIAWLESDDYWNSPHKLQRQVDYLDANPGCSASFHAAACVGSGGAPVTWRGRPERPRERYTVDDLLEQGHFIPSCTGVFRAALARPALEWTRATPFLETTYAVRFALAGPLAYMDEELSTFRAHDAGVYGRHDAAGNIRQALATHRLVGAGFGLSGRPAWRGGLARLYRQLAGQLRRDGERLAATGCSARAAWLTLRAGGRGG